MPQPNNLEALLRRIIDGADPAERLSAIAGLRGQLESVETEAAADAVRAGLSWRQIGAALGISKQAAHRRHSRDVSEIDQAAVTEDAANTAVVSAEVRRAVRLARREAASAGLSALGTEHLLLGLLLCGDVSINAMLGRLGLTAEKARAALVGTAEIPIELAARVAGSAPVGSPLPQPAEAASRAADPSSQPAPRPPLSPLCRRVVARALNETVERGAASFEALDLLAAVLSAESGGAAQTLLALGLTPGEVRQAIRRGGPVSDRERSGSSGPAGRSAARA